MDITQLPFNLHIGLEPATDAGLLVSLPDGPRYLNHVGTVTPALCSLSPRPEQVRSSRNNSGPR